MMLFRWAVFAAGVGDAGDEPFAAGADEVEKVVIYCCTVDAPLCVRWRSGGF